MSSRVETDAEELKEYISKFFADKANEFTVQMKQHMDSAVEKKITNYYQDFDTEPFEDFEIETRMHGSFDCHKYIFSINSYIYRHTQYAQYSNGFPPIVRDSPPTNHYLTVPMLHCIKAIFSRPLGCSKESINNIIQNMIKNPKYFMTNCIEFEATCKKEYALINEEKQELQRLIEKQVENKDYYSELEKKIEQVEAKERVIEHERQKIQQERAQFFAVKQKLDLMKQELQLERDAFEKEKRDHEIKNIDLDDYFQIPVATVVATKVSHTVGETILGECVDL
jgi:hypothetical protein